MKPYPALIALILIIALLSGCTSTYSLFAPNTLNAPMVQKQGDFNLTGNLAIGNGLLNAQAAVSPLNHVILFGSVMNAGGQPDTPWTCKRAHEFGLGYYKIFKSNGGTNYEISILAGYGYGKTYYGVSNDTTLSQQISVSQNIWGTFKKYFVQPSFDFINDDRTLSLSVKLSYTDMQLHAYPTELVLSPFTGNVHTFFTSMEPAITIRWHGKWLNPFFQYKMFFPLTPNYWYNIVTNSNAQAGQTLLGFSFGLIFDDRNLMNIIRPARAPKVEY